MKTLNKEQIKIKAKREKKRREFRNKLKNKGYKFPKIPEGYKKNGSCTSNCSDGASNTYFSSSSSSGSSGSSIVQANQSSIAFYRNPTKIGFDAYFNLNVPIIEEYEGNYYTFGRIRYIAAFLTTTTVTSSNVDSLYASAVTNGDVFYSQGIADKTTAGSEDYTQNPFEWNISNSYVSTGTNYNLVVRLDYGDNDSSSRYWNGWYHWANNGTSVDTLPTPNGNFNQADNDFDFTSYVSNSARLIEFNRSGYSPYSTYRANEVHNILYNCSLRNQEYGIYYGQANPFSEFNVFSQWDTGTYEVKMVFGSLHPTATRIRFSGAVNAWITLMNSTISGSGVSFTRNDSASNPSILVTTKSNIGMGSYGGVVFAGTWETDIDGNGWIYHADVNLNYEVDLYDGIFQTVEGVICEELTQSMGCGGDLRTRSDILNTDFNYAQKNDTTVSFSTIDADIQKLLYTEDLDLYIGGDSSLLAIALNPYNGYISTTGTSVSMVGFAPSTTYNYRTWQAKSDDSYSVVPSYSSTFTTSSRPSNWAWAVTIVQGGNLVVVGKKVYIMAATDWNAFTTKINAFRSYKGLSSYSFTTVSSDDDCSATVYNQARTAINDMSPPTSVPGIAVKDVTDISANAFNGLMNSLNSIV